MENSSPFLTRLLALVVGCGVVAGGVYAVRATPSQVRAVGLSELAKAVSEGRTREAEVALELLGEGLRVTDRLELPPFLPFENREWKGTLRRLQRYVLCLQNIEGMKLGSPHLSRFAFSLSAAERARFLGDIERLSDARDEREALRVRIQGLRREERIQEKKVALIADDLRTLLNLPKKPLSDSEEESTPPPLHRSGILSGLPITPPLELSPPDLVTLRQELERLDIPLPRLSPEEFDQQLQAVRNSISEAVAAQEQLVAQQESLAAQRGELQRRMNGLRQGLLEQVEKLFRGELQQITA